MLRALLSIGCIAIVVVHVDLAALADALRRVSISTLIVVAIAHIAILGLIALRWQIVMQYLGAAPSYRATAGLTVIGTFFNLVLPFNVAGDALRVVLGARSGIAYGVGLGSVVIDRALGIAGLGVLVLLGFFASAGQALSPVAPGIVLAVALMPMLALIGIAIPARRRRAVAARVPRWLRPFADLLAKGGRRHALLLGAAILAVVCHILSAVALTRLAEDIGHPIEFGQGLLLFPGVLLAGMLPISLGGWGLREVAAVEILAGVGMPAAAAVSISLLFIGVLLLEASIGSAAWFLLHRRDKAQRSG